MYKDKLQKILYFSLFALLFGSMLVFLLYIFNRGINTHDWQLYGKVYFYIVLGYTWLLFILLFLDDTKRKQYQAYAGEPIAVIMPCYNEEYGLFRQAVQSVLAAEGNKQIIIIDDGSTNGIHEEIRKLGQEFPQIIIHTFDHNKGKRHALHYAIKYIVQDSAYVVTIDSDTVLDKYALVRIVEPLQDKNIGAATGDVQLRNEHQNLLTRMVGTYYWMGLNIYKKGQSSSGSVVCCSGCLSAYKTNLVKEIIDEFVEQKFFGEPCTHSEDRHLTNLVLKRDFDVVYVPEAISYTETPSTLRGFLRQQRRWKRGFIRESLYTLTFAWKKRKILFLQIFCWDLTAPYFSFGLRLAFLFMVFTEPKFFMLYLFPWWIAFTLVRYIFIVLYAPRKLPGLFIYMFFYEFFLYPINIYALFTVKNKSWVTR